MPEIDGIGLISQLYRNLSTGMRYLDKLPEYFETVIEKNLWQSRVLPNGMVVEFDSFKDFIETSPPKGFGIPIEKFREICRLHPDALNKIDHLIGEDSYQLEETKALSPNQRSLRRRLEGLLKDFSRDEVLQELRKIELITGSQ